MRTFTLSKNPDPVVQTEDLRDGIEEWDFGQQWGFRRVLNFRDPEGVAFQLVEQPAPRLGALHPYGRGAQLG